MKRNSNATPEDQPQKHEGEGEIEGVQDDRIGQRKGGHESGSAQDQPGFVAIPDRRDSIDHDVPVDQQGRQQDEVLRPVGGAEDVGLAPGQIPEHGLAAVPAQPGDAEEQQEQQPGAIQAQVAKAPRDATGMDGAAVPGRG